MKDHYVFYIYLKFFSQETEPVTEVVIGEQKALDKAVALTKAGTKFKVYLVGELVGDYT